LRQRGPPRLARTLAESTLARDQSSRPARPSRSSTSKWSCSNTPALAHSFKRRHAVAGEPQPRFLDWQEPPRGRGPGHVNDRGETAAIRNRSPSAAIPGARCGRQEGCDHLPELVGNKVLSKGRHGHKL
jgi:hypothetical protein